MSTSTEIVFSDSLRNLQNIQAQPSNKKKPVALYAFYVLDLRTPDESRYFGFDIPPMQMELDETAAAEAMAMQEGGVYLDERGQYFKMVQLSGNFGFRPTRSYTTGQNNDILGIKKSAEQIGNAVAALTGRQQSSRGIPRKERTGLDRIIDLQNLFRYYWDRKKTRTHAAYTIMVYANWRMGEVYMCQPLRFRRSRTVPKDKFRISYALTLRLISPLHATFNIKDFLPKPNTPKGLQYFFQKMKQFEQLLGAVTDSISRITNSALDLGQNIVTTVLSPVNAITDVVRGALQSVKSVAEFPARIAQNVHRTCLNAIGVLDDVKSIKGVGNVYNDVAIQFRHMARMASELYVSLSVAQSGSDINQQADDFASAYNNPNVDPREQYPNGIVDNGSGNSVGGHRIPSGSIIRNVPRARTTIYNIAKHYLGSSSRWKEIVLLNGLQPPYIHQQGDGVSVLRPGDPIKIPSQPNVDLENQVFSPDGSQIDVYRYGRDLRMNEANGDVASSNGDIDVVEGLENLRQAAILKVRRKPGDLVAHPWYGLALDAGEGLEIDTAAKAHLQVYNTFVQDPRVDKIEKLHVLVDGDILEIQGQIIPIYLDDSVSLDIKK